MLALPQVTCAQLLKHTPSRQASSTAHFLSAHGSSTHAHVASPSWQRLSSGQRNCGNKQLRCLHRPSVGSQIKLSLHDTPAQRNVHSLFLHRQAPTRSLSGVHCTSPATLIVSF